ncbi:MAG: hypothetical protein PH343_02830, partial [Nitrospira sp.]|nr:hypothetical protein [Nitrospira sp.]
QYTGLQIIATAGSWILVSGLIMMFGNLVYSLYRGKQADANPWGGATLEWQIPSPPSEENFKEIPVIERGPYDFRVKE